MGVQKVFPIFLTNLEKKWSTNVVKDFFVLLRKYK